MALGEFEKKKVEEIVNMGISLVSPTPDLSRNADG
jgi:hypothetical protein